MAFDRCLIKNYLLTYLLTYNMIIRPRTNKTWINFCE